jgi:hypothetical protein
VQLIESRDSENARTLVRSALEQMDAAWARRHALLLEQGQAGKKQAQATPLPALPPVPQEIPREVSHGNSEENSQVNRKRKRTRKS